MRILILAASVVLLASPIYSQAIDQEIVCSQVMPSLLEFTGSVSSAMDTFSDLHDSKMSSEAAKTFDAVAAKGVELKAVVEEYRKLFVLACYGN